MSIHDEAEKMNQELRKQNEVKVRIALFGQPGAGKSSLINRITGQKLAKEGVKTDQTTEASAYDWKGIHLVDLPGYGTQQFPKNEYFSKFDIPSFDLFFCVFTGKFRDADTEFFQELQSLGKLCIFVRNKKDDIWEDGKSTEALQSEIEEDLVKHVKRQVQLIYTCCRNNEGIAELQDAISNCLEGAKKARYFRDAKAYSLKFLDEKKTACDFYVGIAAAASAANALNPVPGLDISVDIGILTTLFISLKNSYGLTDEELKEKQIMISTAAPFASRILGYATREGVMLLLKRYATQLATKEVVKWVPFVGQAIAASIGFAMTLGIGKDFNNDCYEVAKAILEQKLKL